MNYSKNINETYKGDAEKEFYILIYINFKNNRN